MGVIVRGCEGFASGGAAGAFGSDAFGLRFCRKRLRHGNRPMSEGGFTKIGHHKDPAAFAAHLRAAGLALPLDERALSAAEGSPLARPIDVGGFVIGNRWCIHPMEGWDGTRDGQPSEHTV